MDVGEPRETFHGVFMTWANSASQPAGAVAIYGTRLARSLRD